ncbi:unnamed protein product [Cladocopium goreaui]|uniref:Uncharacterized protein n=1 Tax=Cladocopium goreaui TaxID=2562237 RepID=A0A9P1GMW2_9DINO|nr:unnamed protein product [Cladocopium goreaui]
MSSMWVAEVPRQEESFLFTVGSGAAAVIVTKAELSRYLEKGKIHLRKVPEVATCLVAALEASSETAREKAYLQLLNAAPSLTFTELFHEGR